MIPKKKKKTRPQPRKRSRARGREQQEKKRKNLAVALSLCFRFLCRFLSLSLSCFGARESTPRRSVASSSPLLQTAAPMAIHARAWRAVIVLALASAWWSCLAGAFSPPHREQFRDPDRRFSASLRAVWTSKLGKNSLPRSRSCFPLPFINLGVMACFVNVPDTSSTLRSECTLPLREKTKQQVSSLKKQRQLRRRCRRLRNRRRRTILDRRSGRRSPLPRRTAPLRPPGAREREPGSAPSSAAATWPTCGSSR